MEKNLPLVIKEKKINFVKIFAVNDFFLLHILKETELRHIFEPQYSYKIDMAHALPIDFNENIMVQIIGQ